MFYYEIDPASILEDAERTRFSPQTDRLTDDKTDKVKLVFPLRLRWAGGITRSVAKNNIRSKLTFHYNDVIMRTMASQITSLTIVNSRFYSGADDRKDQRPASLAFVWSTHRRPVNSPHKGRVTQKLFPSDEVIMYLVLSKMTSDLIPVQ